MAALVLGVPVAARNVTAVSVIHADIGIHHVVVLLTRPARERIQLRRDRALLLLAFGRHAGVERDSHKHPPSVPVS